MNKRRNNVNNKPNSDPAELKLEDFAGDKKWFEVDKEKKLEIKARQDYIIRLKMPVPPDF